jgi:diguanylate cyclase (GGDEF)-like protein
MEDKPNKLTQFLLQKEDVLHERWKNSVRQLSGRLEIFGQNSGVFDEVRGLLLDLVAVVERTGSVEQAVDAEFNEILSHLKALQSDHRLSSADMVFLLFSMRDAVREAVREVVDLGPEGQHEVSIHFPVVSQVSMLLNRLGLVFFEGAMRMREDGGTQDVLAIEYALLYERARQMAITDRLTGLYNFGYFHERLKEERMRAERYHRLLSLVILDIDHFKKYNDSNGHPAGNEVLKKIATILKQEAREVDIVARYGGEEMVIILPETSRKRATELAERIRQRVSDAMFDRMQSQPLGKMTISAGVATFPVDASTEDDLIKKADSSLYQAKSQGRNRVAAFEPPIKVPITYRPHREISKVALVGSFNNWDKDADAMPRQEDGSFRFVISLNPGIYHYKFVLNDVEWIPDPNCPERVHDGLGGDNSILRVHD